MFVFWTFLSAVLVAGLVVGVALLLARTKLGERRERWQDQTTGPVSALLNALFLAPLALAVVLAMQSYSQAKSHVSSERDSLVRLYEMVGYLPDSAQLRGEIHDYASVVVNQEWSAQLAGQADPTADRLLTSMTDQIMAVDTTDDARRTARNEALSELDGVVFARQARLRDPSTTLPWGLLISLVLAGVVALGHAIVVGLPHTRPSLVSLVVEAVVVAVAVGVAFAIRSPYHGPLWIGPGQLQAALAQFTPVSAPP